MKPLRSLFGKQESAGQPQSSQPKAVSAKPSKQKAHCLVYVVAPSRQDSFFPTYVTVGVVPEGLAVAFDAASAGKLDGFTRGAVVGEYQWLNSENSTDPMVMSYDDLEKVSCDFYETKGNVTSCVKSEEDPVGTVPAGVELKLRLLYHNRAKGTTLSVSFQCLEGPEKPNNKATLALYNAVKAATSGH